MAATHVTDVRSAFELVVPNSIQKMILGKMTLNRRLTFWRELKGAA